MNLHFLPDQNFECAGCGRCCRTDWAIHVDARTVRSLSGSDLEKQAARETGGPPLVEHEDGRLRVARNEEACVFLDGENRCRIHSDLGRDAKPVSCLQFPLVVQPTPDGVVVGVSFYCPTVQKNQGPPLASHAPEVEELLQRVQFRPIPEKGIRLDADTETDWPDYRALEQALAADLEDLVPEAALHRHLMALVARLEPGGSAVPRHDPAWQAMQSLFSASLIGMVEGEGPEEARSLTEALLGGGTVEIRRFEWKGEAARVAEFASRQAPLWMEGEVARFLRAVVFRKFLALERPVLHNLAVLCLLPPILRWYAMASGAARDADRVQKEDLYQAFDVAELHLVSHGPGVDALAAEFASTCRRMARG